MSPDDLQTRIERLAGQEGATAGARVREVVQALLEALESGRVRAAQPSGDGAWTVTPWVKRGILLGFRAGVNVGSECSGGFFFRDRDTFPTWNPNDSDRNVRIVPGGTTVRRGAYIADGVVLMPPSYVNVGAYVAEGSMVDSHALVGSCAQIGRGVHLSAAVQIGGVLEPIGALPVIVEDGVFVGGGCGIYEGTRIEAGAVLAPGVILTRSLPVYDLVHGRTLRAEAERPLVIPAGAVVVPGTRPAAGDYASAQGIHLQTPVIVKYRSSSTDAAVALEEALR